MRDPTTRIAAISGGLGDIGQACAIRLATQGVQIAVGDLRPDHRVDELAAKLEQVGSRLYFSPVDVADRDSVREWFDGVERKLGVAEIVVAAAAIAEAGTLAELTTADWKKHLDVNLTGAMHVATMAASRMATAKAEGYIVLIGSWAAAAPHRHVPAYSVSKAGVQMLCRQLALEYADRGIRVNVVAPGLVDAGLSRKLFAADPALRERMASQIPLRSLTTAEEVAWHVARACDPNNQSMTGATITCDGGLSLVTAAEGL